MAAGGVGNLTVGLGLDAAEFTKGLTKAQVQARQFFDGIAAATAKGTLLGNVFSDIGRELASIPGRFVDMVKGAIDAADHLNDLSKKTGIAVETLGGIGFAAKQAGGDLDSAAAGIGKLNKSIAEGRAGNKEVLEAFDALGISAKELQSLSPEQAITRIADAFSNAQDGPEKAAIAIKLFGKAGADMIPLLNDGGQALQQNIDYFKQYSGVTAEVAAQADQFNDTQEKLKLLSGAFGTQVAAGLLPTLQTLSNTFLDVKQNGTLMQTVAFGIGEAFKQIVSVVATAVTTVYEFGRGLGAVAAAVVAVASGNFSGAKDILGSYVDEVNKADRANNQFQANLAKSFLTTGEQASYSNEGRNRPAPPKARLRAIGGGSKGSSDDPSKNLLDQEIKGLEAGIARERDLLATRNKFLDLYNSDSLLSIKDYYAGRQAAQDDALRSELVAYDKEIAAERRYQSTKGRTQKDIEASNARIVDIQGKRALAEQKAGESSIELAIRQRQAQEDLQRAFAAVGASVDELNERFGRAAGIRFDQQYEQLRKQATAEGNQGVLDQIDLLKQAAVSQADFQKAQLDTQRSTDALGRAEDYLALKQQTGALGAIDGLVKLGELRRAQIPILEAQVQAQEAIAAAARSSGQGNATALTAQAEQARLSLERLKATADPLAESINRALGDDANSALADFVTGTKTASQAFSSFAKSVLNDLLRLGSKTITDYIFGGSGGIGGAISALSGSGGGGQASGLAKLLGLTGTSGGTASTTATDQTTSALQGTTAALRGLTDTTNQTTAATASIASVTADAFTSLGSSLGSFASDFGSVIADLASGIANFVSSLGSSGGGGDSGGGYASIIASLFDGFFADGGTIRPGKFGVVGENGPELAFGGRSGQTITPISGGGTTQNINVTVNGQSGMSRQTAMQQGADIGRGIRTALARND